jgi:hypothetical protein
VLEDEHDVTFDLLKDYLDWALYRQLRLEHGLSYGPGPSARCSAAWAS